ncbi:hypothetical protein A0H81_10450, partial [Grifola frondosa]
CRLQCRRIFSISATIYKYVHITRKHPPPGRRGWRFAFVAVAQPSSTHIVIELLCKMSANDDTVPNEYPYFWSSDSMLSLQEFLSKARIFIAVHCLYGILIINLRWCKMTAQNLYATPYDTVCGILIVSTMSEVTERVEEIKNDASIPTRSNKKKGIKSKKELREEIQEEATEKLKEISIRHGCVSGKWLIFAPSDKVDVIWSSLATSLMSGPLSSTCADLAKVSTCPKNETPNYTHVLCLYMPDVYDKDSVTEVMKILLRNHGMNLMGVKSNLYTAIGLDSKHPSGIQSTTWKNTALMKDSEIKSLKDEYFAELNNAKNAAAEKATAGAATKSKPKLKKKVVADDPFASDDDEEHIDKKGEKGVATASSSKPAPKQKPVEDMFASDEDAEGDADEEEEDRRAEIQAKKGPVKKPSAPKRAQDDEDDEEEAPKKKRKGRS